MSLFASASMFFFVAIFPVPFPFGSLSFRYLHDSTGSQSIYTISRNTRIPHNSKPPCISNSVPPSYLLRQPVNRLDYPVNRIGYSTRPSSVSDTRPPGSVSPRIVRFRPAVRHGERGGGRDDSRLEPFDLFHSAESIRHRLSYVATL